MADRQGTPCLKFCDSGDFGWLLCLVVEVESMGEVLTMQEQAEEKSLGIQLRTPHLSQVRRHWTTASLWPQVSLRATKECSGPVNLPRSSRTVDRLGHSERVTISVTSSSPSSIGLARMLLA